MRGASQVTLTHWDSRTDNLFFDSSKPAGSAESCLIIDWQMIQRQRGAHDLSMLLATSLSVEDRRAHDAEVLRAYHDELCARGVEGYSYDDLCEPAPALARIRSLHRSMTARTSLAPHL